MKLSVASLALASCLVAGESMAQAPPVTCARVEVASSAQIRASGPAALSRLPRFSATRILDLGFTVLLRRPVSGDHLAELRVFTPDGQLYRSLVVPVTSRGQAAATRQVAGFPRPLPQQRLLRVTRGKSAYSAASASLPVAGTDVVSSGLYGRWRVEAYLDGAEERCAQPAWFVLGP
jgi:hypothetical protein